MPTITAELAVIPTPSSYITFLHSSLILSSLSPPPTHSPLPYPLSSPSSSSHSSRMFFSLSPATPLVPSSLCFPSSLSP